jgi:hypothetical protein
VQLPNIFGDNISTSNFNMNLPFRARPNPGKSALKTFFGNTAISVKLTILLIRKVPISTKELLAFSNSLIKWQIFQSMNGVLRDHGPHGPKRRNWLTGIQYNLPNPITIFWGKRLH